MVDTDHVSKSTNVRVNALRLLFKKMLNHYIRGAINRQMHGKYVSSLPTECGEPFQRLVTHMFMQTLLTLSKHSKRACNKMLMCF